MRKLIGIALFATCGSVAAGVGCGDASTDSTFVPGGGPLLDASSSGGSSSGIFVPPSDGAVVEAAANAEAGSVIDAGVPVCGDGVLGGTEACDDGNNTAGDGCSTACAVEANYVCNVPGKPCALIGTCGDAMLKPGEQCDDANGTAGDGCSATCQIEPGWVCPILGASCLAAACGDGLLAGDEECDDGDSNDTNGCSNACRVKAGFKCPTPGQPCVATVCGDTKKEGTEQCDDGNVTPYDGCSSTCTLEPVCPKGGGACTGACGDGIIFPGEACDDGNNKAGDGCSPTCQIEPGFVCSAVAQALPPTLSVPIILRDFSRGDKRDIPALGCTSLAGCPNGHPDFETVIGGGAGMVGKLFNDADVANIGVLDAAGKPVLKCLTGLGSCAVTSAASFAQWYRDVPGDPAIPATRVNHTFVQDIPLTLFGGGTADPYYEFSNSSFFPLDGLGFGNQYDGSEGGGDRNFHFTSELKFWFYYDAGAPPPKFDFLGDDDVWVFVNGKLAVDIGGVHSALPSSLTIDAANAALLGMTSGKVYEFALFQAERHRSESNYRATFRGFVRAKSTCTAVCGDGIKTKFEACDDGVKNDSNDGGTPAYGKCSSDCKSRGPFCGDGKVQAPELCDDGVFNGGYGKCKTDCTGVGPKCGDGLVQAAYGEICDDGAQNATNVPPAAPPYDKCSSDCRSRPRCGDGIVQAPESCDPPNTSTCDSNCNSRGNPK